MRLLVTTLAMVVAVSMSAVAHAEPDIVPTDDLPLPQYQLPDSLGPLPEGMAPGNSAVPDPPSESWPQRVSEPDWEPVEPPTIWRFEIGVSATTSRITDDNFAYWTDDATYSLRSQLAVEKPGGTGIGLRHWAFNQDVWTYRGKVETSADTLFLDFTRRFNVGKMELFAGGGLAGAQLQLDYDSRRDSQFWGGGGDVFGEMYFPMVRFERIEFGVLGRGRVSLLVTNGEVLDNSIASIEELDWGVELRRRSHTRGHYWYIQVLREYQHWGGGVGAFSSDEAFESTALNAGLTW